MKFRKLGSFALAAALLGTSTAIVSYAAVTGDAATAIQKADDNTWALRFVGDNPAENSIYDVHNETTLKIAGIKWWVKFSSDVKNYKGGSGAICINGKVAGWKQMEWGADKEIQANYDEETLEWKSASPIFVEGDQWAQFILKQWTPGDIEDVLKVEVYDKDGNVLMSIEKDGSGYKNIVAAPKYEKKAEETTAAAAETTAAETTAAPAADDTTAAPAADTTTAADADIDPFADYNVAAAHEKNLAFKLGDALDLYDILGDKWAKLATIEATFSWTPGEKWCGGAGIGAAVVNGGTWVMGPEFGAANANEAVAPDGKATQVILDITETPIESIYSVGDDGVVSFGELQVQKWWNCDEAGAKVDNITFKDKKGKVIASLDFGASEDEDLVYAPAPADTTEDTATAVDSAATAGDTAAATTSSKGSPDTGIADVAAVAGLAVAAAGAVVLSRKRK